MSGHSKWSTIKRKKGKADAQKGVLFTKIIKDITLAAKEGGGNPDMNPKLRTALDVAKSAGMPKDNTERAIKRGTGELEGVSYEALNYEGYGPAGVAVLVETVTDSKNRTTSEIRHIFAQHGGNLGSNGCVAWQFVDKGHIFIDKTEATEEKLIDVCIESGGDDVSLEEDTFVVTTPIDKFEAVKAALTKENIKYKEAEITKIAQTTIRVESAKVAEQILKLMDELEEQEDVQKAYANFDIPDEFLTAHQG
jgi:YebC/PmpR family DNA-binding regulatory protein